MALVAVAYQAFGGNPLYEPAALLGVLVNAGLLGAAIFGAVPLLRQAVASVAAAEASRGGVDLEAIAEVLYGEWIAGRLRDGEQLTLFGRATDNIREARATVLEDLRETVRKSSGDPAAIQEWWDRWALNSGYKPDGWSGSSEAQLAFHLADKLEFIGLMCFTGAIPLRIVLSATANLIVQDWALAEHWLATYADYVDTYRDVRVGGRTERVHYHRRHAAWLATIATLWMLKYFPTMDVLGRLAPTSLTGPTVDGLSHRLVALSTATGPIMLPSVARDVHDLVDVRV